MRRGGNDWWTMFYNMLQKRWRVGFIVAFFGEWVYDGRKLILQVGCSQTIYFARVQRRNQIVIGLYSPVSWIFWQAVNELTWASWKRVSTANWGCSTPIPTTTPWSISILSAVWFVSGGPGRLFPWPKNISFWTSKTRLTAHILLSSQVSATGLRDVRITPTVASPRARLIYLVWNVTGLTELLCKQPGFRCAYEYHPHLTSNLSVHFSSEHN